MKETEKAETHPTAIISEENIRDNLLLPDSEAQSSLFDTFAFLIYGLFFLIVIFFLFADPVHSKLNHSFRREFSGYDNPHTNIVDKFSFFKWAEEMIEYTFQYAYKDESDPGKSLTDMSYVNTVITDIRLTQRRMKLKNGYSVFREKDWEVWRSRGFGSTASKDSNEDDSTLEPEDDEIKVLCEDAENNPCKYSDEYRLSGYTYWFPVQNNHEGKEMEYFTKVMSDFQYYWVGKQTRSIIIDLVLYNPYVKVYTYIRVTLKFTEVGTVESELYLGHLEKNYYKGYGLKVFRAICEVIFVVFLLFCIIQQPFLIYWNYRKVKSNLEDQLISREKYIQTFGGGESEEKTNTCCDYVFEKAKLVLLVLYEHFTDIWNILNLVCIVLSVLAFVYWLMFVNHYTGIDISAETLADIKTRRRINDDFLRACELFDMCKNFCAFSLIFIFIRILKCLVFFSHRFSVLFGALDKAKYDLVFFLVIVIAIMLSFIMFIYFYFGPPNDSYAYITRSMSAVVQLMNWWYQPFDDFMKIDVVIASLVFIIFIIVITFVLINMFVGFLHKGYKEANRDLVYEREGRDKRGRKVNYFIEIHPINRVRDLIYKTLGSVNKEHKEKYQQIKDDRKKYKAILTRTKNDRKDFDVDYNPMKSFGQEKSRLPLTSHFIEQRANLERDLKCGKILYSALLFVVFISIFIVQLFLQLNSKYGSDIVSSSNKRLINSIAVVYNKTNNCVEPNSTPNSEDPEDPENLGDPEDPLKKDVIFKFSEITDLDYLNNWIKCGLPKYADDHNKHFFYSYVINNTFRVTLRKGEQLKPNSPLDGISAKISSKGDLNTKVIKGEMTETITTNDAEYVYSHDKGYLGRGGYVEYWQFDSLDDPVTKLVKSELIDGSMWLLAIEFATYEVDTKIHVYNAIRFTLTEKGEIIKQLDVFPLYFRKFSSSMGVATLILEIIVILFLLYYMFMYIYDIVVRWKNYDAWIEAELPYFSNMEIFQRREKCPEFLRKLKSVFTLFRILDVIFFGFTIAGTVFWLVYTYKTRDLIQEFAEDGSGLPEEYLTDMRQAYSSFRRYIEFSSLALIVLTFRLMEYLQYAGNMKVLTGTIENSLEDMIYFFLMFMVLLLGFAGMGNVVFAQVDQNFGTFGDSLMSCFLIALGEFDITALQDEKNLTTLFFVFLFLVLFTYILFNILLAILEINYSLAKTEVGRQDEKVRKLNALMCCCLKPSEGKAEIEKERKKVDLHMAIEMLDEMTVHVGPISSSMRWWADGIAQQIYEERKMRKEFRRTVIEKVYKIPIIKTNNEKDEDVCDAIKERKDYLHYLRMAAQLMDYQYIATENKLQKVERAVKEKYEDYERRKAELYKGEKIKKTVSDELAERRKKIGDRLKEVKEKDDNRTDTIKSMDHE
eukprot:TRINITY_DN872_c0_g2_i1.p1 TRINITY_DN872_c0_g2~~TRINITY_DN872_c0_g2_i1.p1  ORF type:complete len:1396 (+),score=449.42 TRINITY_DN872_c0_g2_i1:222-4409(+)